MNINEDYLIIETKIDSLNYSIFKKTNKITIIKSILYHLDNNIKHILPIEHFNTNIDSKLISQLHKLPSLVYIKENKYYQNIFPNIRIWTLSTYYIHFNRIINQLFNLYNKSTPIKIGSNIYQHYNNIELPYTNERLGSIYIFYTDSEYYKNLEFYQNLTHRLKLYFNISLGKQYICIKCLSSFGSKLQNKLQI